MKSRNSIEKKTYIVSEYATICLIAILVEDFVYLNLRKSKIHTFDSIEVLFYKFKTICTLNILNDYFKTLLR